MQHVCDNTEQDQLLCTNVRNTSESLLNVQLPKNLSFVCHSQLIKYHPLDFMLGQPPPQNVSIGHQLQLEMNSKITAARLYYRKNVPKFRWILIGCQCFCHSSNCPKSNPKDIPHCHSH